MELFVYLVLMNFVDSWIANRTLQISSIAYNLQFAKLWRAIYFILFSSAYWFIIRTISLQRRILQIEKIQLINEARQNRLEKELIEIENARLAAQINPHLVFNTLNFIYNSVQQASNKASEAVVLLAELMNYSLVEHGVEGKVNLEKELQQINNLIKINQIRFDNRLFLDVNVDVNESGAQIIPLGLIVFVENIFKHGDLTDPTNSGRIRITHEDGVLAMTISNKKKKRSHVHSHGIGLKNVVKRFDNIYPGGYTLDICDHANEYSLYLRLNLA